jgi:hypothetical protein
MPIPDAELLRLRQTYHAAYSAYQSCARALTEAGMSGEPASDELLEHKATALRKLSEARERYRDALGQGDFIGDAH